MMREGTLEEISDGRLYSLNDMVKADCNDCSGCSACCHGMGTSIVLDPYDIWRLMQGLSQTFEQLLASYIELNVTDGIILPNLKMAGQSEACAFLNEQGRCQIHKIRPGICRLFPLGRYYENDTFQYFLQIHECPKQNRTKIKVRKWIDTPNLSEYEAFINTWHYFIKAVQERITAATDENYVKQVSMYLLKFFYLKPYGAEFYPEFNNRMKEAKDVFS